MVQLNSTSAWIMTLITLMSTMVIIKYRTPVAPRKWLSDSQMCMVGKEKALHFPNEIPTAFNRVGTVDILLVQNLVWTSISHWVQFCNMGDEHIKLNSKLSGDWRYHDMEVIGPYHSDKCTYITIGINNTMFLEDLQRSHANCSVIAADPSLTPELCPQNIQCFPVLINGNVNYADPTRRIDANFIDRQSSTMDLVSFLAIANAPNVDNLFIQESGYSRDFIRLLTRGFDSTFSTHRMGYSICQVNLRYDNPGRYKKETFLDSYNHIVHNSDFIINKANSALHNSSAPLDLYLINMRKWYCVDKYLSKEKKIRHM